MRCILEYVWFFIVDIYFDFWEVKTRYHVIGEWDHKLTSEGTDSLITWMDWNWTEVSFTIIRKMYVERLTILLRTNKTKKWFLTSLSYYNRPPYHIVTVAPICVVMIALTKIKRTLSRVLGWGVSPKKEGL